MFLWRILVLYLVEYYLYFSIHLQQITSAVDGKYFPGQIVVKYCFIYDEIFLVDRIGVFIVCTYNCRSFGHGIMLKRGNDSRHMGT